MSLKAKIEAVIYASEEPVTLAQLTGLLGQEGQSELDHLDSAQQLLALDGESSTDSAGDLAFIDIATPLPEADIEGSAEEPAQEEPKLDKSEPSEPEPEETVPTNEPEPTDSSPVPEHPVDETPSAPADKRESTASEALVPRPEPAASKTVRDTKAEEKLRERRLRDYFREILDELIADYATSARGLEIREVAGGYRLATKPEYHDAVRGFVKSLKPPLKLSLQALETLAVVAYKQPVTAPEISEIRGVDSGGVLGSLMARKLITTAGRKQVIGRPILYKTTRDFLLRFGLKDVSELPSIEEFEKMAGELADVEPIQEEIPMQNNVQESPDDLKAEADEVDIQSDGDSMPLNESDDSSVVRPETAAAKLIVESRNSGLPPLDNALPDQAPNQEAPLDSPAMDAELQKEQAEEEVAQESK